MSLFGRRNEEPRVVDWSYTGEDVTLPTVAEPRAATEIAIEREDDEPNGRIGKGSRVSGKLRFEGSIRIYGEVEGEITAEEAVIIRRGARVNAKIHANEVVIEGDATADVQATARVEIGATGKLRGTVATPRLVVHDGAIFDGTCSMPSVAEAAAGGPDLDVERIHDGAGDEALFLAAS
jgi:cytoskeletal protein CcmA (bactofilin family)